MTLTILSLFKHTMNSPTGTALVSLIHGASSPKKSSSAGFKVIPIGLDKLPISILDTTPLTGHVLKKSTSFDSLANAMCS